MADPLTAPRPVVRLLRPFQAFFQLEASGSILLLAATAAALIWANSPFADSYFHLWETTATVGLGDLVLSKTLHHWINDGLMAAFFFVIGLEIKREILVGELSTRARAALPIAGALGGMVAPALLYIAFNAGSPMVRGWGIPMATDIAFSLGILALMGPRMPGSLKVFLAALAIADDLGAVLVIAIFYTASVSLVNLVVAGLLLAAMFLANRAGVRQPLVYAILGFGLWLAVLGSGVHATVAGVLGALAIPIRRRIQGDDFLEEARSLLEEFAADVHQGRRIPTNDQRAAIHSLEQACERVETPLTRMEHTMLPWVSYLVVPLFALANAGVALPGMGGALREPVALGIVAGLVLGKPVGVLGAAWLAVRLRVASLPQGVTWRQLQGVATLCGIGFTMSLFIADLALHEDASLETAKAGILLASLVAGIWGWIALRRALPRASGNRPQPVP